MAKERYVQVGVTALRDAATGEFLPAEILYIKSVEGDGVRESEERMIKDFAKLTALRMRDYVERKKMGMVLPQDNERGVSV